jgi:protoporphyrinogen oxidase
MTTYDYIIVGAGLSGLYSAYKLLKENPDLKILILERNRDVGGRVDTQDGLEAGAGRFHENQPHIMGLIRELGLAQHMVPIETYEHFIANKTLHTMEPVDKIIDYVIKTSKKIDKNILKNMVFLDYVKQVLSIDDASFLLDFYGYSSELTNMNAYDTINLMKNHLNHDTQFYTLQGGLSQIVRELTKRIDAKIMVHRRVVDIHYNDKTEQFEITCDEIKKKYKARKCICAVTKETLLKIPIFKPIYKVLQLIETLPLCRIYAKFPITWFKGMPQVTINNNLRIMIPIDEPSGLIMMSYTDNKYARFWKRLLDKDGIDALNREHQRLIKKTTGLDVPAPQDTKVYYWEHGVVYFKPGFDSETMLKQIRHPIPNIPLYVCGENYSEFNGQWMEGALDTYPGNSRKPTVSSDAPSLH